MLTKLITRRFSPRLYTLGHNFNNLGRNDPEDYQLGANVPYPLDLSSAKSIKKIVSGYSESLVLNEDGSFYSFGTKHVLPNNETEPALNGDIGLSIRDADIDYSHAIFLTSDGKVLEQNRQGVNRSILRQNNVSQVACGNGFSLAVVGEGYGEQKVYVWPTSKAAHWSVFCSEQVPSEPVEIKGLSELIERDNTRVKKLKVVDNSIAVLLENGVLATWGDNKTGNLAVPRSILLMHDFYVADVKVPMLANHIDDFVRDFDLSSNNIIILSERGDLYTAGRDKNLRLKKLSWFEDKRIASVGSFYNNYVIVTEEGEVFTTENPKGEKLVKYWGDYNLYQYDPQYFDNGRVRSVSGKYDNAFAVVA